MRIARQNIAFMTVHGDLMTVTISLAIQPFATILILYQLMTMAREYLKDIRNTNRNLLSSLHRNSHPSLDLNTLNYSVYGE
jgi:hypothetical protein